MEGKNIEWHLNETDVHVDQCDIYVNSRYKVAKYDDGEIIHLSIKRLDGHALQDWRELQRIKNELLGEAVEAVCGTQRITCDCEAHDPRCRGGLVTGQPQRLDIESEKARKRHPLVLRHYHPSPRTTVVGNKHLKDQIRQAAEAVKAALHQPKPTLGIDLDGCVDEAPGFFHILTTVWPGDVIVVTFRSDREKAIADLEKHRIRFTDVVLVRSFDQKAEVIAERQISFYIDDQPEMLKNISTKTAVMLFRNEGNFDFEDKKWMMSDKTGKLV